MQHAQTCFLFLFFFLEALIIFVENWKVAFNVKNAVEFSFLQTVHDSLFYSFISLFLYLFSYVF